MKPAVRLIASDIDGTLIPPGGQASARTLAALRAAEAAGVTVVLVTGRAPRTARLISQAVGVHGPAICANGALVVDLPSMEMLRDARIDGDLAVELVADLTVAVPDIRFAWERGLEWGRGADWPQALVGVGSALPGATVGPVGPQAALTLSKLVCYVGGVDPVVAVRLVREVLNGRAEVFTAISPPLAEITARGIDKREALEWLCARMGVRRDEVVAIGDGPNDLPMLLWAGRGIAMGNAHVSLLDAVSERTHSHQEDGFAAVIEGVLAAARPT